MIHRLYNMLPLSDLNLSHTYYIHAVATYVIFTSMLWDVCIPRSAFPLSNYLTIFCELYKLQTSAVILVFL
jgi:hypothetical protein